MSTVFHVAVAGHPVDDTSEDSGSGDSSSGTSSRRGSGEGLVQPLLAKLRSVVTLDLTKGAHLARNLQCLMCLHCPSCWQPPSHTSSGSCNRAQTARKAERCSMLMAVG